MFCCHRHQLRETWAAMLQMVPQLSRAKAKGLVANPEYTCLKRTVAMLSDESVPEATRMTSLASAFGPQGKNKVVRNETKLSTDIYRAFTTTDPAMKMSDRG